MVPATYLEISDELAKARVNAFVHQLAVSGDKEAAEVALEAIGRESLGQARRAPEGLRRGSAASGGPVHAGDWATTAVLRFSGSWPWMRSRRFGWRPWMR